MQHLLGSVHGPMSLSRFLVADGLLVLRNVRFSLFIESEILTPGHHSVKTPWTSFVVVLLLLRTW